MSTTPEPAAFSPRAIEALLAFWEEAGVTVSAAPQALNRLTAPAARAPVAPPPKSPTPTPATPVSRPTNPVKIAPDDALASARALAAGAADLAALAEAIAAFEGCALRHAGASKPVILRGDPATADILVIGDAPAAQDDATGQPFQGSEGQLLDRMLAAAGLTERALLINTVFWRTPGGAAPASADQAACRPFLERAAALLKPKAALLVGAAAARGVLRTDEPILKLRGRWASWTGEHETLDIPTLPTFSPAFLLAQPLAKKRAWGDLLTLAGRVDPRA